MKKPTLLALLPCGLRNPFKSALYNQFPKCVNEMGESETLVIDGNLNYEKSFYDSIDKLGNLDSLPDILITSDINSFYHKTFVEHYLNTTHFEPLGIELNDFYKKVGYAQPGGLMTMLPANILVIVVDTHKVENTQLPSSWEDLLDPQWERKIALRGDDDFFCNAVFFPYVNNYGMDSLTQLAKNTKIGLHPSQMVKKMNSDNTEDISLFVLPYTFYKNIKNKTRYKLIWPKEGAIVSPVQMLVKKGKYEENKIIVDYIISDKMIDIMLQVGFPTCSEKEIIPLYWLGWDYIKSKDIQHDKLTMQEIFFRSFKKE